MTDLNSMRPKSLTFLIIGLVVLAGCATDDVPEQGMNKMEVSRADAADWGIDFCDLFGWYDDDVCDLFCPLEDPDCAISQCEEDGGTCVAGLSTCQPHGTPSWASCGDSPVEMTCCMPRPVSECQEVGGLCLSSPIDVTFPANCEEDYGMDSMDAECFAMNQSCCAVTIINECEGAGGTCVAGLSTCQPHGTPSTLGCGDSAVEQTCCIPRPVSSCEEEGGLCLSSPIDVTFPANCEDDFGMESVDAECAAFNQSCCVATIINECEEAGGTCVAGLSTCQPHATPSALGCGDSPVETTCCMPRPVSECQAEGGLCLSSPIDVTFPANCEDDFGMESVDAVCFAFNQSCCTVGIL